MSNYVFLIDSSQTPMNPIHPAHARKLLESGKAAVFRRYPFTLIMKRVVENIVTYPLTLKIDPGSKFTGIVLVNNRDEVIWGMELKHRGQTIKDALLTRRAVRSCRRQRNTRYRQPRFLNRTRSKGWLAPSLLHRVLTVQTWVKRLCKLAPIAEIRQELVRFDTQKMESPEITGVEYQQGTLAGYEVREYLLEKWGRKCTYCSKEDVPLQIEHIQSRSSCGSDRVSNLCLACEKCNLKKGTKDIKDFLKGQPDLLSKILKQAKSPLKDASAVNSTRCQLFETLKAFGLPVLVGTGGQTKYNRTRLGLQKEHWLDAACVGTTDTLKILNNKILKVESDGQGTRRLCRINKYGFPCSKPRQKYATSWKTGDIGKTVQGIVGRVVVQNEKRLEIRVNGLRHYCKHHEVKPMHRKDGYSYAEICREFWPTGKPRPTGYGYARWEFQTCLQFPVVKLLDYEQNWQELEQSTNPFAIIVMAHLRTKQTKADPQQRFQSKLSIVRGLYERGYTREQILQLFRLIEWMMVLPEELERSFRGEVRRYQEERRMPYITGFERDGMVKMVREDVIEVLETRFEAVPQELKDSINEIEDLARLKRLHKRAITVASVEDFEQVMAHGVAESEEN